MRVHEMVLSGIRDLLAVFEDQDPDVRTALLEMQGTRAVRGRVFGAALEELLAEGFLRRLTDGRRVALASGGSACLVGLRAADRCDVLWAGTSDSVETYVKETFTQALRIELLFDQAHRSGSRAALVSAQVSSSDWLDAMLAPDACERWRRVHERGESGVEHIYTPAVQRLTSRLVEVLSDRGLVRVLELASALGADEGRELDQVFQAVLRYMIVFPGLDPESGAFVLGLHPTVGERLSGSPVAASEPAAPVHVDVELDPLPSLLVPDLHQVLVAVGGGHVRLRADRTLFKKDQERIAASFATPPESRPWPCGPVEARVEDALEIGEQLGLVATGPDTGGRERLVATETGRAWITRSSEERLQTILDRLGPRATSGSRFVDDQLDHGWLRFDAGATWFRSLSPCFSHLAHGASYVPLRDACMDTLRQLPVTGGVNLVAFITRAAGEQNPLLGQGPHTVKAAPNRFGRATFTEELEDVWATVVAGALEEHLARWGGLRAAGLRTAPEAPFQFYVGLSAVGRWLVGLTDEFPQSASRTGHIVVQPTFEVLFLEPDPEGAARLAPFCNRAGESVGVVFTITKASVLRAAAAGIPLEAIRETLEALSRPPVPGNVLKEIESWHGRQRVLVLRRPWVLDCGDEETADCVMAVASKRLERLTDVLIAIRGHAKPETVARELAAHGLNFDTSEVPQTKKRRPSRRRRW